MTTYMEVSDSNISVYMAAKVSEEMSYLRSIWRLRNKAFREFRARGVSVSMAVYLAKQV